jgi:phytoene synthase
VPGRPVGELQEVRLEEAYRACRRINARYGRTYFLATRLLPADSRPAVHALYGFARLADEIVDNAIAPGDPEHALNTLEKALAEAFAMSWPPASGLTEQRRRRERSDLAEQRREGRRRVKARSQASGASHWTL